MPTHQFSSQFDNFQTKMISRIYFKLKFHKQCESHKHVNKSPIRIIIPKSHYNSKTYKTRNILFTIISSWLRSEQATMTQTLKFFKLIRELFRKMGIQNRTYNLRNSFILIILAQMFVASAVFLLFEADSIEGYGQSFYLTATSLLLLFLWPYFIHNMDNLFHLMNQMDKFGQNRGSKKKIQSTNFKRKISK